jgi:hypothetical protein
MFIESGNFCANNQIIFAKHISNSVRYNNFGIDSDRRFNIMDSMFNDFDDGKGNKIGNIGCDNSSLNYKNTIKKNIRYKRDSRRNSLMRLLQLRSKSHSFGGI